MSEGGGRAIVYEAARKGQGHHGVALYILQVTANTSLKNMKREIVKCFSPELNLEDRSKLCTMHALLHTLITGINLAILYHL